MICPTCGHEEVPVVEEQPLEATEAVTEASVEIARIEADRDVTLAKIGAKTDETIVESEIAQLRGELAGMRELLDRIAPKTEPVEDAPEPVVVVNPEPEPVIDEPEAEAPAAEPATPKAPKRKNAWW